MAQAGTSYQRASGSRLARALTTAAVILAGAVCIGEYILLYGRNGHAPVYHLLLLYGLLLPVIIVHLRAHEDRVCRSPYLAPWIHAAILFAAIATIVAVSFVLKNGHVVSDESAYRFQAQVYKEGRLKAEPMPGASLDAGAIPPEIRFEQTIQSPSGWFSKFPPGWPLLLTIGYFLRAPWLMNPVFGIVQLLCVWYLARPFGRSCQWLAISMAASSMYFVMWSMGFMSHASDAAFAILAMVAVLRAVRERKLKWVWLAFGLVFVTTEIRPYSGAVIGCVCAAILGAGFRRNARMLLKSAGIAAVAAGASGAAFLADNWVYTGNAFVSPYAMLYRTGSVEEFAHTAGAVWNNIANITRWEMIGTVRVMFPFMILLAVYAIVRERRWRFEMVSLSLLFPALVIAHVIKQAPSGTINGDRFYYEGFCALAVVAARGAQLLIENWRIGRGALMSTFLVLLGVQLLHCAYGIKEVVDLGRPYTVMYGVAKRQTAPLVFVHESEGFIAKHTNWNAVDWRSAPAVYLIDPGPERRDEVACRFGQPVWSVISYDPGSGRGAAVDGTSQCPGGHY
jgi:hypothetical protein